MDVLNYHRQNLKPVSAVYTPDPDIKLRDQDEFTKGGLDFTYVNILLPERNKKISIKRQIYNTDISTYVREESEHRSIIIFLFFSCFSDIKKSK